MRFIPLSIESIIGLTPAVQNIDSKQRTILSGANGGDHSGSALYEMLTSVSKEKHNLAIENDYPR